MIVRYMYVCISIWYCLLQNCVYNRLHPEIDSIEGPLFPKHTYVYMYMYVHRQGITVPS